MDIIALRIYSDYGSIEGFKDWLDQWLDDFLIEDYDGIVFSRETKFIRHLIIPIDQIKPDKLEKVVFDKIAKKHETKYPDTTASERFLVGLVFRSNEFDMQHFLKIPKGQSK